MRSEYEANRAIEQYSDMVKRICFLHLKNHHDTDDIFQNVFLKYVTSTTEFASQEHEKAWFARVTINACKDLLKSFFHKNMVPLDAVAEESFSYSDEQSDVLEAVLSLPKKYKDVVYLFYYENYTAVEIAKIMNKNENTVYTLLSRARKLLKEKLGGDDFEQNT